jgi:disintegrin and metalloproteinase domain-containing protein 10
VLGDNDSYVHGSISADGVFHGRIITSKDSYYVEKAHFYFPNASYIDEGFHSVIYKDQHVTDPYKLKRTVHPNGCGLTDDVSRWMDQVQNSVDDEIEIITLNAHKNESKNGENHYHHHHQDHEDDPFNPHEKYSKYANNRQKRATTTGRYQERNTCSLYIQTDPLIWRHIRESIPDVRMHFVST